MEFLEYIEMNNYAIELEKDKQSLFRPIYNQRLVELETLKTYIETSPANNFIQLFKSSTSTPILFNQKPNRSFYFCVDY